MRICAAQYDVIWENKHKNMLKCEAFFKKASALACNVIVFPELSLTGFTLDTSFSEPSGDSETIDFFVACSKKYGVASVFGVAVHENGKCFNRLVAVDACGNIVTSYDKIHPFSIGEEPYKAGNSVCSFALNDMDIGLTICYDLRFPELFRKLSQKCNCIIVSANWSSERKDHWLTLLKARAIENQCYIVGCNRVGDADTSYSGDSVIIAPDGKIIACAEAFCEELIYADISSEDVRQLRSRFPVMGDKRTELYRNFYE
ncbi:MAG: carbon-nitrogen family hydrolase [Ruminococcaceae bacterium]|nr:carbon-nitrogen family hydrolase [Oscillospiraceae bacterium]